jgi:hypothetical protein
MGYIRQLFDPINCYQEIQFFFRKAKAGYSNAIPNWFNLSNTEKYWVHESKDIKDHLLSRECANFKCLNPLSNHIGLVHQSSAISLPKR